MGTANDPKQPFRGFIVCALLACASGTWLNYYSSRASAIMKIQGNASPAQLAVEVNHANLWMLLMLGFGFASVVFLLRAFSARRRAKRRAVVIPIATPKSTGTERYASAVATEQKVAV